MSFNTGKASLSTLNDVALSTALSSQTLGYNATTKKWENKTVSQLATFNQAGALTVQTGTGRFSFPVGATILGVSATVGTAPSGSSLIVDVLKNGSTIFTTTANRPTIASGTTSVGETVPDVTSVNANDYLTVSITQVGSSTAGSDLTVQVRYKFN